MSAPNRLSELCALFDKNGLLGLTRGDVGLIREVLARLAEAQRERDAAWTVREAAWVQTEDAIQRATEAEQEAAALRAGWQQATLDGNKHFDQSCRNLQRAERLEAALRELRIASLAARTRRTVVAQSRRLTPCCPEPAPAVAETEVE